MSFPHAAFAGDVTVATKSRTSLLKSQIRVLEGRAATQYSSPIILTSPSVLVPGSPEALAALGMPSSPYLETARRAAARHRVPEDIFLKLVRQESGWQPRAVSPKGAIGLAQLMPQTARRLRVNPRDPAENLEGGARYLRMMYDRFGTWRLALAAYNAGPEAVERYKGVPPYRETRGYVAAILGG